MDVELVRNVSEKIEQKIAKEKIPQDKIDRLTTEEMLDLNKIVDLANFMLCKYEDKKSTKAILENFLQIINGTCESIDKVDDEIAELLMAAEDSIGKIRDLHTNISDKSDLGQKSDRIRNCANNLTNIPTEINLLEYQQSSQGKDVRVI